VFREVCAVVAQLCDKQSDPASTGANSSNAVEDVSTGKFNKLSKKARKAEQKRAAAAAGGNLKRARVRIEVVSIVGGMSEQKQRRQLAGRGKPVHVVVATPGRLCEMFEDPDNVSFQDMSKLRFLVVDEADRIMEDGHYPEVH
jgi:ATP-dependent RNA helicase DDX24/MAK5